MQIIILLLLLIFGYAALAYYTIRWAKRKALLMPPLKKIIFLSFWYALLLGIGAASNGGSEPGFAFPVPALMAFILTNYHTIVETAVYPLIFWWSLIFLVMFLNYKWSLKKKKA